MDEMARIPLVLGRRAQETVQMLTRHWVFVDALGRLSAEVMGPGARHDFVRLLSWACPSTQNILAAVIRQI